MQDMDLDTLGCLLIEVDFPHWWSNTTTAWHRWE